MEEIQFLVIGYYLCGCVLLWGKVSTGKQKEKEKRNNYNYISILQVGVRSTVGNCFDSFGGGGVIYLGRV